MKEKNSKFKHRLQHLPVAYTGLALGVGGLGNCIMNICSLNSDWNFKWIPCISISIVIIFLTFMLLKNIMHPKVLKYELNEPLSVSLLPTFAMSLMLVAGFIGMWNKDKTSANQIVAAIFMCLAILIQLIITGWFIKSLIVNHIKNKEQHMYGTYFVPTVGLITACTVTSNITALPNEFFQAIWYFGFVTFVILLPVVTYSMLFKEKKVSDAQFPSIAVWFAPANLSAAGFIQTFMLDERAIYYNQTYLHIMSMIMIMIAFCVTLILYLYVWRIISLSIKNKQNGFSPILCSLSFPSAIGSTSLVFLAKYLHNVNKNQFTIDAEWLFSIAGLILCILSSIIILYLVVNMFWLLYKTIFTSHKDNHHHSVYQK